MREIFVETFYATIEHGEEEKEREKSGLTFIEHRGKKVF